MNQNPKYPQVVVKIENSIYDFSVISFFSNVLGGLKEAGVSKDEIDTISKEMQAAYEGGVRLFLPVVAMRYVTVEHIS